MVRCHIKCNCSCVISLAFTGRDMPWRERIQPASQLRWVERKKYCGLRIQEAVVTVLQCRDIWGIEWNRVLVLLKKRSDLFLRVQPFFCQQTICTISSTPLTALEMTFSVKPLWPAYRALAGRLLVLYSFGNARVF